jgi:hypothetical protein
LKESDEAKQATLVAKAQALALEIVQKSMTFLCSVGFRTDNAIRPDLDSWKLVFDRLLPVSFAAVDWVLDYVCTTEGGEINAETGEAAPATTLIKAHLFDNVDEDSRMVRVCPSSCSCNAQGWLHRCLRPSLANVQMKCKAARERTLSLASTLS